jgi:Flp pilus assembly pilin Flp
MKMLHRFLNDDSGAVTVDWVVLTAGVVGLGFLALGPIFSGTTNIASVISTRVSQTQIGQ